MQETAVFENIYQDYLNEISSIDLSDLEDRLGVKVVGKEITVPFFGVPYKISKHGILDDNGKRPVHAVSVILCKYILLCPKIKPTVDEWVTYKDFPDAAPMAASFVHKTEIPISKLFSGRLDDLKKAGIYFNGISADIGISSDLSLSFQVLPKVPMLMLFNDRDDEFPAQCTLLFERRAENYLDMECIAMCGWWFAEQLKRI